MCNIESQSGAHGSMNRALLCISRVPRPIIMVTLLSVRLIANRKQWLAKILKIMENINEGYISTYIHYNV